MRETFGSGLHAAAGRPVDASAYEHYLGRWSRLFVPAVLAAAEVARGSRVLDVATGPGEAALVATSVVESAGLVVGADISLAMLRAARARLDNASFWTVAMEASHLSPSTGRPSKQGQGRCRRPILRFPNRAAARSVRRCKHDSPDSSPASDS